MHIEIAYQTWEDPEPVVLVLAPQEYFDPLEPGETFELDAIPRFNHTWQYLNVPVSKLKWSTERREGTADDTCFRTQYLDEGRSWMNHRRDPDGYEEIIHYTQLAADRCHIIRTCKLATGNWFVVLNCIIQDKADGSQQEQRLDSPWTPEDCRTYSTT